ncbi:T9SS type B sorting domain-containing protein [Flavobacterium sp. N502540]|uniref:T9SS type B sorting domain-containing protein n=1 Tax=Flavobacterium sp. N502540 TaxID=2986838 RepID=UPI002224C139|nr:T9SS type B sorting domain-containing protein [Flavobacterium sp. N502540]
MKQRLLLFFFLFTFQLFSQNTSPSIGFKENKGQIIDQKGKPNTAVKYLLNTNGLNVQLKKNGFSYDVYEVKKTPRRQTPKTAKTLPHLIPEKDNEENPEFDLEYTFHRIDIDFVNSNSKVELVTEKKSTDFDNYYNIPNKPEGITGVYQYKQITYKNIYPNIDVVFTIPNDPKKVVEYNFVIHPKGKISDIQLKFNGAETDLIDNKIQMNVRFGKMEETLPASWIEDRGTKKEITVGYTKIKKNVYGFDSTDPVNGKTIVIDPVPTRLWGTYYGDIHFTDEPNSINLDHLGNTIFTGSTESTTGIATSGSFQSVATTFRPAFIVKLNSNGVRIWGTYLGGAGVQCAKINSLNQIYIAGYASTGSLSTPNTYKEIADDTDGLLMKFDTDGQRIWGTYFGGKGFERIDAISIDNRENIIIAGETHSFEGIATPGGYQTTLSNSSDYTGFFAKFNKDGSKLLYGSYFPFVIKCSTIDQNDNVILAGNQYFSDFYTYPNIATTGAFKTTHNSNDGFIIKFNSNFTKLWCTYYGGDKTVTDPSPNSDIISGIGSDNANNIYIVGSTTSSNNMATIGAFKTSQNIDGKDAFIAKFNTNGERQWGTYFGGDSTAYTDFGTNCFVSSEGNIYLIGYTDNPTNISTPNSFQSIIKRGPDGYIANFSTSGDLNWSTYYGGKGGDFLRSIDVLDGKIVVSGRTVYDDSSDLSTPGTHKTNGGGFVDVFVAEFQDCQLYTTTTSNSPICINKTLELKASGGTNYLWTGPNGFTSTDQNPTITNATSVNSGEYSCLITGTGGCDATKKTNVVIGDIEKPIPDITNLPVISGDCHTVVNTIPTATDVCAGIINGTTTNPLSYNLPGTYTIVWNYNDGSGNIATQNQIVKIISQPLPVTNTPQTFCIQQNATLASIQITGNNIKWYDSQTTGALLSNTTLLQNGVTYYATQTINGCESERIPVTINIQNTAAPTGNANQPFCTGQNPTIANIQTNGNAVKWYDSLHNGSLLVETTNLTDGKTYYASQTINGCEGPRFGVTVSIVNTPSAPTGNTNQQFCKSENATLSNLQITGQNIKWYDTSFSAAVLPSTTLLENNRTYYASQTTGCESDRTPILVQVHDTALPIGNSNQQFCIDENATIANLAISGSAIKWYDAATNGTILQATSLLQNRIYYASQTLNNCESERLAITVKIQDTQKPIADSRQTFCFQQNASIKDINIIGQNIKWFESNASTVALLESTALKSGITYYASQTIANCESDRISVAINILEATNQNCIHFVEELPFPKFFTPNNDGYNDTWTIDFGYLAPNTVIQIYDRYGKFIKELTKDAYWDGTYLGKNEPTSDYWFTATRSNGKEYRGHFTLKR